jgi:hypothetical protein
VLGRVVIAQVKVQVKQLDYAYQNLTTTLVSLLVYDVLLAVMVRLLAEIWSG